MSYSYLDCKNVLKFIKENPKKDSLLGIAELDINQIVIEFILLELLWSGYIDNQNKITSKGLLALKGGFTLLPIN